MSNIHPLRPAVQWHEGMLLMPEHFQQSDRRVEELLHFHLSHSVPFYWGIKSLAIDPAELLTGTLSLITLEAVMPDGTPIIAGSQVNRPLKLNLSDYYRKSQQKSFSVHLAIPAYAPGAAQSDQSLPRYLSEESQKVADENTGEGELRYPSLVPNISLIAGEEPSAKYSHFPLIKISFTSNTFEVDKSFIPPALTTPTDGTVGALCLDLAKRLREKIAFLSERLQNQSNDVMSQEAENAVKSLSRGLLPFEAIVRSNTSHPFQVYLSLCHLAGQITDLHPGQMPPSFSPYHQNEVGACFTEVMTYINTMLGRIQEGYTVVPLTLEQRVFKLPLRQAWMNEHLIFGAKASPEMSEKDLVGWINKSLIATDRYVTPCREKRILGAARSILEEYDEMKLLPAQDVVLFSVDYDKAFIDVNETLQIFNVADSEAFRPDEIVMYVPKRTRDTYF